MKYTITEMDKGFVVASMPVTSATMARREVKRWKKQNSNNLIFVEWYRSADGQHGYLNPDGSDAITGKAW